jgi:hypothetical protein
MVARLRARECALPNPCAFCHLRVLIRLTHCVSPRLVRWVRRFCARTNDIVVLFELRQVDFPCVETTACAFGGSNLERLFVTTGLHKTLKEPDAGKVFVVDGLGVCGVPSFAYGR